MNKTNPSLEEVDIRKRLSPTASTDDAAPKKIKIDSELNPSEDSGNDNESSTTSVKKMFAHLDPIPDKIETPLLPLSITELQELESVLEFWTPSRDNDSGWKNDWSGNLGYFDKEIENPLFRVKNGNIRRYVRSNGGTVTNGRGGKKSVDKMSLFQWAVEIEENFTPKMKVIRRLIKNLIRQICTYKYDDDNDINAYNIQSTQKPSNGGTHQHSHKVPVSVVKLFSSIDVESSTLVAIEEGVRRASYDPQILTEDGWTVEKSDRSEGASGGPMRIGEKIRYEGSDAVVIAFIHDIDLGDLWKAVWLEDYISFDLEVEELIRARQKWEKFHKKSEQQPSTSFAPSIRRKQGREAAIGTGTIDFTVKGIEYGIVLAASYARGARPGVYWPARVMHASEVSGSIKRNSSKSQRKLDLMFLAPYWNSTDDNLQGSGKARTVGPTSLSENEESFFDANPLFQPESVDAGDDMIKQFPYTEGSFLDINQLQMSFRFTGLPKSAFRRFLDSYRLATSLYEYSKYHMEINTPQESNVSYRATAALFETHPLSVQVPLFPTVVLHLPFSYILAQQPYPSKKSSTNKVTSETCFEMEPVIQLNTILKSMKPPQCWDKDGNGESSEGHVENGKHDRMLQIGHNNNDKDNSMGTWIPKTENENMPEHKRFLAEYIHDFPSLSMFFDRFYSTPAVSGLLASLNRLLQLSNDGDNATVIKKRNLWLKSVTESWTLLKGMGDECLGTMSAVDLPKTSLVICEWRLAMERAYRYLIRKIVEKTADEENTCSISTLVITDATCNEHRTSDRCIERRVRLPAALKGAKLAGAKTDGPVRLSMSIPENYMDYAENELVLKAHDVSYLKRMKSRCLAASTKEEILVLTDDSDGNGGEDTRGSEGTWKAALCGVAAAVAATDSVVRGECRNAFCITRPPGHHAGRSLHPMKAVSNGFCILNPVACAAIHATTPLVDGGLGLNRVCVIDFDVHHGNGTQDILCSTYDPRFLYISLHAGGAWMNGTMSKTTEDPMNDDEPFGLVKNPKQTGIYPGRCGDTSPHKGVLNVPLGSRVMSHAVGTALLQRVTPAVKTFSPDLIILSAGFDAHKNDPMGLGGLSAEDFGNITEIACQLAIQVCSGRVVSVLEGGYGVPCCRPQRNTFLPTPTSELVNNLEVDTNTAGKNNSDEINPQTNSNNDVIAPTATKRDNEVIVHAPPETNNNNSKETKVRPQPSKLLDLGENLPPDMDDQVPYPLQMRLEKCTAEGFIECVYEHVAALARNGS